MATYACLDGIHQQHAVMLQRDASSSVVKLTRHALAGIPFTLNGLNGEEFDENVVLSSVIEGFLERFNVVGGNENEIVPVLETGKVFVILPHAGMRNLSRPVGPAVEAFLDGHHFDGLPFMLATFLRHEFGIDIGDSEADCDGFGSAVHANEFFKRTPTSGVSQFFSETFVKPLLGKRGRHHVRHHPVVGHRFDHAVGTVASSKHPVSTVIVDNRTV